jgi:hypothetical protein
VRRFHNIFSCPVHWLWFGVLFMQIHWILNPVILFLPLILEGYMYEIC